MKNITIIILLCFVSYHSFSQSAFDKSLNEVSADIAAKLSQKNKKKIVVLYITNIKNTQTVAGKYIADVISYNLVNNSGNFLVFDRENLSEITDAKKLIAEGYIDAATAKKLGKILAVEAIIIGHYTVLSSTLKLSLKALDVNSGLVIAATMQDLPLNADAGALLGINISNNSNQNGKNRGFNTPIKSDENYNNPNTVNNDCETKNTGDYCFTNNTQYRLRVYLYNEAGGGYGGGQMIRAANNGYMSVSWSGGDVTIEPGQTECFYNIKATSMVSDIRIIKPVNSAYVWDVGYRKGNILVEKCKSKTFIIK